MKFSIKELSSKFLILIMLVTISACASKKNTGQDEMAADQTDSGVSTQGSDDGSVKTVASGSGSGLEGLDPMKIQELLRTRAYYFAFDRFSVTSSDELAVRAHGQHLAQNPNARVRLEGHTDERGTREYNIALGERRGNAVRQVLLSAGARSNQIEVISYGEEKPKAQGQSEAAYAENRRVDLKYTAGQP